MDQQQYQQQQQRHQRQRRMRFFQRYQQQQQQQHVVTESQTPIHSTTDGPVSPPAISKPQFQDMKFGQLGHIEEFVIGCLSGLSGAAITCLGFTGLQWLFYAVLIPSLIAEMWESWILFSSASRNNGTTPVTVLHQAATRKRLARQLFGQGVIMGQAAQALQHDSGSSLISGIVGEDYAVVARVVFYACVWLAWITLCHIMDSVPVEDTAAVEFHNRKVARKNSKPRPTVRRSASGIPAGAPKRSRPAPPRHSKSASSTRSTGSTKRVRPDIL